MSTTPVGDGDAMAAAREAGGWAALLFLAAELDRKADETAAESAAHDARGDQDASFVAYGASGAWRAAASMARVRAQSGSDRDSGAAPVSPDTGEAQARSGDLSAADGITAAAEEMHDIINRAQVVTELKERLADAARFLEIAGRDAVAAERERLAQEAEKVGATFRSTYSYTEGQSKTLKFADYVREVTDDA